MAASLYVFDTSALEQLRSYFPKQFPSFWKHFDQHVEHGIVVSVREVRKELEGRARPEWFDAWLKKHQEIFLSPNTDETKFVAEIFAVPHFWALVGSKEILRGTPVADPFVIATAKVRGGCVVTQEANKPNAAKIPNVCRHFRVRCLNFEEFMDDNGWSY